MSSFKCTLQGKFHLCGNLFITGQKEREQSTQTTTVTNSASVSYISFNREGKVRFRSGQNEKTLRRIYSKYNRLPKVPQAACASYKIKATT
jgi:hypothetical protein